MDKEDLPLEGDPNVEIIGSSPQHQETRGLYSRKDRLGERQRLEQLLTAEEEMAADNPDAGEDYKLHLAELNFQLLSAYASERNPQAGIERGLKAIRILEGINRGSEEVGVRIDQTLSQATTSIAQLMDQTGQLENSIEVLLKGELGKESGVDKQLKALAIARTLAAMNHEQYGGYPESLKPAVIEGLHRAGRHDEANELSETPANNDPQA